MEIINQLVNDMFVGLTMHHSGRTEKYVTSQPQFRSKLTNLCYTIAYMAANVRRGASILVNGESYLYVNYAFPKSIVDIINAGKVYAHATSYGFCEPIHSLKMEDFKDAKLMTPDNVENFFYRYNENQPDGKRIITVPYDYAPIFMTDFTCVMCKGDRRHFVHNVDGGTQDEVLAFYIGLESIYPSGSLVEYPMDNEEIRSKWLIQF